MFENRSLKIDVLAVVLMAAIVLLTASLLTYDPADPVAELMSSFSSVYQPDLLVYPQNEHVQNACGRLGAITADLCFTLLGQVAWYVLASLAFLVFTLLRQPDIDHPLRRALGWLMTIMGSTTMLSLVVPGFSPGPVYGSGGCLGKLGQVILSHHFAAAGSVIVALGITLAGVMLATEYHVFHWMFRSLAIALVGVEQYRAWRNARRAVRQMEMQGDLALAPAATSPPSGFNVRIGGKTHVLSTADEEDDEITSSSEDVISQDIDENEHSDEESEADELPAVPANVIPVPANGQISAEGAKAAAALLAKGKPGELKIKTTNDKRKAMEAERAVIRTTLDEADATTEPADEYQLPSIQLLQVGEEFDHDAQAKEVRRKAKLIDKTFHDFNMRVRVVEIETGPVIAQYEIELEPGLKLSKVSALADDLAISLRVPSVRVVAPIPGKNTVGIEVPNEARQTVRMREVIEEANGRVKKMLIPLFLGKDVAGNPLVTDLAKLPHLLIAGSTGTGKSVCLNTIIASFLMTRRPDEVRMLMIDPKQVELSGYGRLPHLMHPVVTDPKKAEAILNWAVEKMEERYTLLAKAGVRHITNYNQIGEEELIARLQPEDEEAAKALPRNLPFIVIVVDEFADLMMTCGKEVEQHIIRLAQKSRAVGIHLILATQKPTVDVITGLIKSNMPARICCKVTNRTDSRVVLDEMGAEKLLGMGDMLFLGPGTSQLMRGQGTFLDDNEINSIVDFVTAGRDPQFVHELVNLKPKDEEGTSIQSAENLRKRDPVYEQAIEVVIREGRGSVSLLQRALGIGYGRAARLIDFMAEDGIVGQYNGSQAREVVISIDDWHKLQSGESIGLDEPAPPPPKAAAPPPKASPRSAPSTPMPPAGPTVNDILASGGAPKRSNRVVPEPWEGADGDEEEIETKPKAKPRRNAKPAKPPVVQDQDDEERDEEAETSEDESSEEKGTAETTEFRMPDHGRVIRAAMKPLPMPWDEESEIEESEVEENALDDAEMPDETDDDDGDDDPTPGGGRTRVDAEDEGDNRRAHSSRSESFARARRDDTTHAKAKSGAEEDDSYEDEASDQETSDEVEGDDWSDESEEDLWSEKKSKFPDLDRDDDQDADDDYYEESA
jgi:S-DNA-T family DNA segregation ATPase FtsK/SpoIIIE